MAFVRKKRIRVKEKYYSYAYLVKNKWTKAGPRQEVIKYIGKLLRPELVNDISFNDFISEDFDSFVTNSFAAIVKTLILWELYKYGCKAAFDNKSKKILLNNKEVVLEINQGFLCAHNIWKVLNFRPLAEPKQTGLRFAETIRYAGIDVPKEIFIVLFNKIIGDN